MTFPADLAKLYVKSAGQQYMPSNGTEGEVFWSEWCCQCSRDRAMREGAPIEDCDDDERCDILGASFRGEAKEWVYGTDGQPICTAFHEPGTPEPYRCPATADMFGGAS
jgi:hypothetical protein